MNQQDRDRILGDIGVRSDGDGLHITLKDEKQRNALADTIRNADTTVSFGSNPKVYFEPEGQRENRT